MDTGTAVSILSAVGLSGVVGTVVNNLMNKRRLGADVTKIATDAAGGVIERLEAENVRQGKRNDVLEQDNILLHDQLDGLREQLAKVKSDADRDRRIFSTWRRAQRETSQLHAAWDALAIQKLRDGSPPIEMPDAPPLSPPTLPLVDEPGE